MHLTFLKSLDYSAPLAVHQFVCPARFRLEELSLTSEGVNHGYDVEPNEAKNYGTFVRNLVR